MAGYEDTRQKIISTLMGRPVGTEIQPENHQDYALNMLDYIRSLELIATSTLIGVAESNTTPVQPNSSRVCYIAGVAQNQTVVFENFIDENGNPISVTTGDMEGVFIILLWNTQYWSAQTFSTNIISRSESATFYYRYNIRKTYESVDLMNADVTNPIGTDGNSIKIGDLVSVVNSTTPAENAFYSYEGSLGGWKLQYSFNFQVEQVRSQDTNTSPSSKLFDDTLTVVQNALSTDYAKSVEMIAHDAEAPSPVIPTGTTKTYEFSSSGLCSWITGLEEVTVEKGDKVTVAFTAPSTFVRTYQDVVSRKVDDTQIEQTTGTDINKIMSQKAVTDNLELKIDKMSIKQVLGTSTTDIISQKGITDYILPIEQGVLSGAEDAKIGLYGRAYINYLLNGDMFINGIKAQTENRYLDDSGNWQPSYYSIIFDVRTLRGKSLTEEVLENFTYQYSFLVSFDSQSAEFCDGTGRVQQRLNNTQVPNDANYLCTFLGETNTRIPRIYSSDALNEIINVVTNTETFPTKVDFGLPPYLKDEKTNVIRKAVKAIFVNNPDDTNKRLTIGSFGFISGTFNFYLYDCSNIGSNVKPTKIYDSFSIYNFDIDDYPSFALISSDKGRFSVLIDFSILNTERYYLESERNFNYNNSSVLVLQRPDVWEDIDSLSGDTEELKNQVASILNVKDKDVFIDSIRGLTKLSGFNADANTTNGAINASQLEGFDTYYLQVKKPVDVYFSVVSSAYVSICKGECLVKTATIGTLIYFYCTNPVRYRNLESNLPTSASKLHLDVGDILTISVTAGKGSSQKVCGLENDYDVNSNFRGKVLGGMDKVLDGIAQEVSVPVKISQIQGITKKSGFNCNTISYGIAIEPLSGFDSYYFVADKDMEIYFGLVSPDPFYLACIYGTNATAINDTPSIVQVSCSNAARVRNIDDNLPTESSKLTIHKGDFVCFTLTADSDNDVNGIGTEYIPTEGFIKYTTKACLVQYIGGSGVDDSIERLEVFIPKDTGYIKYLFVHTRRISGNADIWRMSHAYSVSDSFVELKQLVISGEWEIAVSLDGRPDFSGGYAHGDQVLTDVLFFLDGKKVDITNLTEKTSFYELKVVEASYLYDPSTGSSLYDDESTKDKIAHHGSVHTFNKDGIDIQQTLDWMVTDTLSNCYLAMFPVSKSAADKMILDTDYVPQNISYGLKYGVKYTILYDDAGGYNFEFSIPKYQELELPQNGVFLLTDNGGENYHKEYFIMCASGAITSGDKWVTETKYNI